MTRYTIGKRNGISVVAEYVHGAGSLAKLTIKERGALPRYFQGSSLGPANPACAPEAEDLRYWQWLAKLEPDEVAIGRTLAAHQGIASREDAAWSAHGDEMVACPRCEKHIPRRELDALGQCTDCEEKEETANA